MTAIPMALRTLYTYGDVDVDVEELPAYTVTLPEGTIDVPTMVQSTITYSGSSPRPLSWALYVDKIPLFDEAYRKTFTGNFLDRFLDRRICVDTPDQWMQAVRRWANVNMPYFNELYRSTAVELPLDNQAWEEEASSEREASKNGTTSGTKTTTGEGELDVDGSGTHRNNSDGTSRTTVAGTSRDTTSTDEESLTTDHSRDVTSLFPQSQLSGNGNYASDATDNNSQQSASGTSNTTATGSNDTTTNVTDTRTEEGGTTDTRTERRADTGSETTGGTTTDTETGSDSSTRGQRGRQGATVAALLMEQRQALMNVDALVLESAETLFLPFLNLDEIEPGQWVW